MDEHIEENMSRISNLFEGAEPGEKFKLGIKPVWDDLDAKLSTFERSDFGNAERLLHRHGHHLKFVNGIGWVVWNGNYWDASMGELRARKLAHNTAKRIRNEAWYVYACGARPAETEDKFRSRVNLTHQFAVSSGNQSRINGMLKEAQPYCLLEPSDFNRDPLKITVGNITIDFSKPDDLSQPHNPEDHISLSMNVEFDPDAKCTRWLQFLNEILPDPSIQEFLQRWFGYCLSGMAGEQKLVFFYGSGANGKSTLVDVLCKIMGSYAATLPFASLLRDDRKRGSEATPDFARLPGKRLVRASEPERRAEFSQATLKLITGGEPMTVRNLNQDFFEFQPEFKLVLQGNHKPEIRSQDHGIWRRIVLVPFTVTIAEDNLEPNLEKVLLAEAAGILNWLIAGFFAWQEHGLSIPPAITNATLEYKRDSDPIGQFLEDCTRSDYGSAVSARDLFSAYKAWCANMAIDPWKSNTFGRALTERNLERKHSNGTQYQNIKLDSVPWEAVAEKEQSASVDQDLPK